LAETIQGNWDDLIQRPELHGRTVRVIILDEQADDPWVRSLRQWADGHEPLHHLVDDSREAIYSGSINDPR
jgi:hypothetical protein